MLSSTEFALEQLQQSLITLITLGLPDTVDALHKLHKEADDQWYEKDVKAVQQIYEILMERITDET